MGKSRSATCVAAYLMHKYHISPSDAIAQIRESRPLAEPNEGFMQQLELYHQMNMPVAVEESPIYQRWLYQREVRLSSECGQAPDADKIRFEDEHVEANGEADLAEKELRCKKCRYGLSSYSPNTSEKTYCLPSKSPYQIISTMLGQKYLRLTTNAILSAITNS
jgi:dual specificity phosphatase 12